MNFLVSSPIKRALRMCYSEPSYEEREKQLNSTTKVSIPEEISTLGQLGVVFRRSDWLASKYILN